MFFFPFAFATLIFFTAIYIYVKRAQVLSKGAVFLGSLTFRLIPNSLRGISRIQEYDNLYREIREGSKIGVGIGEELGFKCYMFKNPDLLDFVLVKKFLNFTDRRDFAWTAKDRMLDRWLVFLKKDKWLKTRPKLAKMFASGRLKELFVPFSGSCKKLIDYIEQDFAADGLGTKELDISRPLFKFSVDVSASSIVGFDSQLFNKNEAEPPTKLETLSTKLFIEFNVQTVFKFMIIFLSTTLADWFGFSVTDSECMEHFRLIVDDAIENREKGVIQKNDMLQHLIGIKETDTDGFNNDDIEAFVMNTFMAGWDTIHGGLLFSSYHIALNPHVQKRLREEIDEMVEKCGDEGLSYESVTSLKYLDLVVKESLRISPPIWDTFRTCVEDTQLPGPGGFVVKAGQAVIVPIYSIHHDPDFYPQPEKFIPERFSEENLKNLPRSVYLPFGGGPRKCIAGGFAVVLLKTAIVYLLSSFILEPSGETSIPLRFKDGDTLKPLNGMHLRLTKRVPPNK